MDFSVMAHLNNRKLRLIDERKSQGRLKHRQRPLATIEDLYFQRILAMAQESRLNAKMKAEEDKLQKEFGLKRGIQIGLFEGIEADMKFRNKKFRDEEYAKVS